MKTIIDSLQRYTGVSRRDCAEALKKCGNVDIAAQYIMAKGQAVARYKITQHGERVRWNDANYIAFAREQVYKRITSEQ